LSREFDFVDGEAKEGKEEGCQYNCNYREFEFKKSGEIDKFS